MKEQTNEQKPLDESRQEFVRHMERMMGRKFGTRLVQQYFGAMRWYKEGGKEEVTVHKHLMAKKAPRAWSRGADFIVKAAGRHVRHAVMTGNREATDFFNVTFRRVSQLLTSYLEITAAERTPANASS